MNKKIGIILGVVATAILLVLTLDSNLFQKEVGEKIITLNIKDDVNNVIVLELEEFDTDTLTLGEFFDEYQEELAVVTSTGEWGRSLDEIKGLKGDIYNPAGPWLLYSSDNNQACIDAGYCPGIDSLPIADGDIFNITLTPATN